MKNIIAIVVTSAALSGCATWLPANVQEISEGKYSISATGNSFASIEEMKQKVINKAETKCEGKGFDYEKEPKVEFHKTPDYVNGGYQHYTQVTTVVVCKT